MTIGKVAIGLIIALVISPLIVYLALPSYSTSAASIPVVNNLVVVADEVYVTRAGVRSQITTKQTTLQQGDTIETLETGRALINFFDGSSTQLEPDTVITVDELSLTKAGSTTIQFTQQVGSTWSRVAKLVDTKSSFNIQTAAAVAVIRGTLIAINVQEDDDGKKTTEVKVFEGLSDVIADGQTVQVGSGTQTTVDEGQPPDEPIVIPPPPAELDINVASPVWLHVADPLERNAGIVPPGFDTNEIPYSTNSGTLGGPQNIHITEPVAGTYYVMMHSRGDGPVTLSVDGLNDGSLFEQRAYATFDVVSGGTYYVTIDLDVDAGGHITLFDASHVYLPPQSDFTTDKTTDGKASVVVNDAVQFTGDYGDGHYTSCLWDFGDGNTSDLCHPAHTYAVPGVYTVSHVVDNPVARQTSTKTDYVTVYDAPQANFTSNYTEVVAGDSVSFSDASTANPTVWAWDFGDDATSTDQNPAHIYPDPGTYSVSLTASNLAGDDTETKTGHVKVYAPIVAFLTADPTAAIVNVPVQFTDASVGVARTWSWNFGDGDTSTDPNPAHTYESTGTYTVTLDVTNPLDSDTVTKTDYITVYEQPVTAFVADQTSIPVGATVSFTDQSTGGITAWAWDFGDQNTSIDQNPLHIYNTPGIYSVLLTASNPGGGDDVLKTSYITVYGPPQPDFSADDTEVYVGQNIQFTDLTTGIPTLWQPTYDWDFGDESGSTDQNPTHSYGSPGTYIVSLTVTNPAGDGTEEKTAYITVYGSPRVDFSADDTTVYIDQAVQFTDLTTGVPSLWQPTYSWDFGDQGTSTDQNPAHSYNSPGTYTVSLTVTNPSGNDTMTKTDYISVFGPPVAAFVADQTSVVVGTTIDFTDLSTDDITAWAWDFGDQGTCIVQNPSHTYTQPGVYSISLTASNPGGSDNELKADYITVYPQPVTAFVADQTSIPVGATVSFTDQSTGGITAWAWDFGDQNTSIDQNPLHIYNTPGIYSVLLTASNPGGGDDVLKTSYITVYGPPQPDFSADDTAVQVGQVVQFDDLSTGVPSLWQPTYTWDFGDESSSTAQEPTHTYNQPGIYSVSLTVSNPGGSDVELKVDYITVYGPPQVDFSADITEVEIGQPVQFTDLSTGEPSAWQWVFEDDEQIGSAEQNPTHIYTTTGIYSVTLRATNAEGDGLGVKRGYINVYGPVEVTIISPYDQDRFMDRIIEISGYVTDPSRETVTVTVNGSSSTAQVMDGMFSLERSILPGENTITVTATNPGYSDSDTITVYGDFLPADIVAELTWNTGEDPVIYDDYDDVDSHLIWPQSENYWDFYDDDLYDCYYFTDDPDWDGSEDVSAGDPVLDIDNTWGWGPENITLEEVAADGRYWYFVHFYWDEEPWDGSTATVRIWINGVLAFEDSRFMEHEYIWECAYIDWANGTGTVNAGPADAYYPEDDMLDYHVLPVADFSADALVVEVGQPVQFTDLSTEEPGSWQWEFGDESGSTDQNPIHAYDSPGAYTVSLAATNASGTGTMNREEYIQVCAPVTVTIDSPENDAHFDVTRYVGIDVTVNDPTIDEATVIVNGIPHTITVRTTTFRTYVVLEEGENTITIEAANPLYSGSDTITINSDIPQVDILTKLTWDTDKTDVDSHLIYPQNEYYWAFFEDETWDCHVDSDYFDWNYDDESYTIYDPQLEVSDRDGYGPEYIALEEVDFEGRDEYGGRYWFFVYFWDDIAPYEGSTATVEIWINGELAGTFSRLMQEDYIWECAYIDWADGDGTVHAGPEDAYYKYYDEDLDVYGMDEYHGGGGGRGTTIGLD